MPECGKRPFWFKSKEEMQYFFLSRTRKAATAFQIIDKEKLVDTGIKSSNSTYQFYFHALLSGNWKRQKHSLQCRRIPLVLQVIWVKAIGQHLESTAEKAPNQAHLHVAIVPAYHTVVAPLVLDHCIWISMISIKVKFKAAFVFFLMKIDVILQF